MIWDALYIYIYISNQKVPERGDKKSLNSVKYVNTIALMKNKNDCHFELVLLNTVIFINFEKEHNVIFGLSQYK